MKARELHRWDVDAAAARRIQDQLRRRVSDAWVERPVRTIAGADVSFPQKDLALAVVVVLRFPDLQLIETAVRTSPCTFPYVPGLLSFREIPALLRAFEALRTEPDVILFDAQGIAHPRRLGLAAHAGLLLDTPAIGCAKSRLYGTHEAPGARRGSASELVAEDGDVVGAVLRTRSGVRPIYVSVGHRIDLQTAVGFVLASAPKYRIPEPLRLADRLTKEKRAAYR